MTKSTQIKEIQKRLPENIYIVDETNFDFTEDEFVSILSWIKYFNNHYENKGKTEHPDILFPIISKRLRLDFGLYCFPSDIEGEKGKHNIYLSTNGKLLTGKVEKQSVKKIIATWQL
ncbi:hypothetical protein JSO54_04580 [Riemerella anatipestifer]|uniref:hypothetical protein n=1 Tax=Riemerella anatipestifer TaxID=34085 RepID=UPI001374A608|nr:hypothetical protein [Riemerella anatipestifer]